MAIDVACVRCWRASAYTRVTSSVHLDPVRRAAHRLPLFPYLKDRTASTHIHGRPDRSYGTGKSHPAPKSPANRVSTRSSDGASAEGGSKQSQEQATIKDSKQQRFAIKEVVLATWRLLIGRLGLIVVLFSIFDGLVFVLHRISHQVVNQMAVRWIPGVTPDMIGNMWYLSSNTEVASFQTGYKYLVMLSFLVVFPIIMLLRAFALTAAYLSCSQEDDADSRAAQGFRNRLGQVVSRLKQAAAEVPLQLNRVWMTAVLATVWAVPWQALSLTVLLVPWTLPRLLWLQLAFPVAVFEKEVGRAAIRRSGELVRPVQWTFAVPYLAFLAAPRLISMLKETLLRVVPPRILREVPELPICAYFLLVAMSVLASRLHDLLPLAVYLKLASSAAREPNRFSAKEKPAGGMDAPGTRDLETPPS